MKKHRKIREIVSLILHQFTLIGQLNAQKYATSFQCTTGQKYRRKRSCKIAVLNDPNFDFFPFLDLNV